MACVIVLDRIRRCGGDGCIDLTDRRSIGGRRSIGYIDDLAFGTDSTHRNGVGPIGHGPRFQGHAVRGSHGSIGADGDRARGANGRAGIVAECNGIDFACRSHLSIGPETGNPVATNLDTAFLVEREIVSRNIAVVRSGNDVPFGVEYLQADGIAFRCIRQDRAEVDVEIGNRCERCQDQRYGRDIVYRRLKLIHDRLVYRPNYFGHRRSGQGDSGTDIHDRL